LFGNSKNESFSLKWHGNCNPWHLWSNSNPIS
jgi:hypothetical protein